MEYRRILTAAAMSAMIIAGHIPPHLHSVGEGRKIQSRTCQKASSERNI